MNAGPLVQDFVIEQDMTGLVKTPGGMNTCELLPLLQGLLDAQHGCVVELIEQGLFLILALELPLTEPGKNHSNCNE